MNTKEIKNKIVLALEAVDEIQDKDLKLTAFSITLGFLLNTSISNRNEAHIQHSNVDRSQSSAANNTVVEKRPPILNSLSITHEQISEIYEVTGDILKLRVKAEGDTDSEQQQKLAHLMLFGYKVLMDVKEVSGSKLLAVAKEWDIPTGHFVKNVKLSKHLQVRNSGKGKDPIFSLRPGTLDKLVEEVRALAA